MPRRLTTSVRVSHHDLNAFGDLRSSACARLLQQAAIERFVHAGWQPLGSDRRPRAVGHDIEYLSEARYGDSLACATWLDEGAQGPEQWAEIRRSADGAPVVRAQVRWVWICGES